MTTRFDSFDASPLGAFVKSPVAARNRPVGIAIIISWLDENTEAYQLVTSEEWIVDNVRWLRITGERDTSAFVAAVFDAPIVPGSGFTDRIMPLFPVTFPPFVRYVRVPRSPTVAQILAFVKGLVPQGRTPRAVLFFIDDSGSMSLATIDPQFTTALQEMRTQTYPGIPIRFELFTTERWIRALGDGVEALVPAQ